MFDEDRSNSIEIDELIAILKANHMAGDPGAVWALTCANQLVCLCLLAPLAVSRRFVAKLKPLCGKLMMVMVPSL